MTNPSQPLVHLSSLVPLRLHLARAPQPYQPRVYRCYRGVVVRLGSTREIVLQVRP